MNRFIICIVLVYFSTLSVLCQTVTFFSASSPNSLSSSWSQWRTNGRDALEAGQLTGGTPGTPSYFDASDSIMLASEIITTSDYLSWHGQTNPGSAFGPGFANEKGNMYSTIFLIKKTDAQFSLDQVTGTRSLSGSITFSGSVPGLSVYSPAGTIGVLYGLDQAFGGGDDTYITSGTSTQSIDALLYGPISWNVVSGSVSGTSDQDRLNNAISIAEGLTATTTIYLNGVQIGSFAQTFQSDSAVPEPATYAAIYGITALGLAYLYRGRRNKPLAIKA
ncbi:MAG: hypothetical protein WC767_00745 [Candidatus Paceibacterota bacterium]